MRLEYYLDDDFVAALYERAMRAPRTIPQSLSDISAVINAIRAEREEAISRFDSTLAHLEEIAAALRAKARGAPSRTNARRQSVAVTAGPVRGLFEGSKRHRIFMIVSELTKEKGSARIPEIAGEMERLGLFANVGANKTQNATNTLHQLKRSRHLDSDRGNWFLPVRRTAE